MWLRMQRQLVSLMLVCKRMLPGSWQGRGSCLVCSAKVFEAEAKKLPSVKAMLDEIVCESSSFHPVCSIG